MPRFPTSVAVFGFLILASLLAPASSATDEYVLTIFFDDPKVTTTPPTRTEDLTRPLCGNGGPAVCKPGTGPFAANQGNVTTFAAMVGNGVGASYLITGEIQTTLWLSAEKPLPITGLAVELRNGTEQIPTAPMVILNGVMRDADGDAVLNLTTEPQQVIIAAKMPAAPHFIAAGANLAMRIWISTLGTVDSEADVLLHYGSVEHASSLTFPISLNPGANRRGDAAFRASLDGTTLNFLTPDGTTTQARTITPGTELVWGPVVADHDYEIVSDAVFRGTLGTTTAKPDEGYFLDMKVRLAVNGESVRGITQVSAPASMVTLIRNDTGDAPQVVFTAGLPFAGTMIHAGDQIQIGLTLNAKLAQGTFQILYGSETHPTGLWAAAVTGATPAPPVEEDPDEDDDEEPAENETGDNETEENGSGNETIDDGQDSDDTNDQDADNETQDDAGSNLALHKNVSDPGELPGPAAFLTALGVLAAAALRRRRPE